MMNLATEDKARGHLSVCLALLYVDRTLTSVPYLVPLLSTFQSGSSCY